MVFIFRKIPAFPRGAAARRQMPIMAQSGKKMISGMGTAAGIGTVSDTKTASSIRWKVRLFVYLTAVFLLTAGIASPSQAGPGQEIQDTPVSGDPVSATSWDASREVSCADDQSSCCLLQVIMAGTFDHFDPDDMLNLRIFSAALSQVKDITPEDLEHFVGEFSVDPEEIENAYCRAFAACLYADILYRQSAAQPLTDAEQVLLLFLEPSDFSDPLDPSDEEKEAQKEEIRSRITDEMIALLAEKADVPEELVRRLILQPVM